jgi:predicted transcriptional regulator of viral defense system
MNYLKFRQFFFELGCFTTDQVFSWQPSFDRNNLHRWVQRELIVRLKRGWYTFPEYLSKPDYAFYFSNRIYKPSYVSLHTALAFYGLIPEAVTQITAVSSLKTIEFVNQMGTFVYKSVSGKLFFGYEPRQIEGGRSVLLASPEKALLDLLYLYPQYQSLQHMDELRFDEELVHELIDVNKLLGFARAFYKKALLQRLSLFQKAYNL